MLNVYLALLLMHLLYDWHWQGETDGILKRTSNFVLVVHCATYALLMYAVLIYYATWIPGWILPYLFLTHLLVDWWKCRKLRAEDRFKEWAFIVDQSLHLLSFAPILLYL